jgi:hypothetical protein
VGILPKNNSFGNRGAFARKVLQLFTSLSFCQIYRTLVKGTEQQDALIRQWVFLNNPQVLTNEGGEKKRGEQENYKIHQQYLQ